jgi:hypothetical protein
VIASRAIISNSIIETAKSRRHSRTAAPGSKIDCFTKALPSPGAESKNHRTTVVNQNCRVPRQKQNSSCLHATRSRRQTARSTPQTGFGRKAIRSKKPAPLARAGLTSALASPSRRYRLSSQAVSGARYPRPMKDTGRRTLPHARRDPDFRR